MNPRTSPHSTAEPDLLIAGAPRIDRVRLGDAELAVGGGPALYAALGATLAGAHPALVGRWPADELAPLRAALGYRVDLAACPEVHGVPGHSRFEYDKEGRVSRRETGVGLESLVRTEDIPASWQRCRALLVPPLAGLSQQLAFVRRTRAASQIPLIAALLELEGSANRDALELLREVDVVFLDLKDACTLATSASDGTDVADWLTDNARWSIVSLGAAGFWLLGAGRRTVLCDTQMPRVDPTGRLAALAGAVMGSLSLGRPIEEALHVGVEAAATASETRGLDALLAAEIPEQGDTERTPESRSVHVGAPRSVVPDYERVAVLAKTLAGGGFEPFRFDTPASNYPPIDHPGALDYFFAVVMHQYGFWELDEDAWTRSMYATVNGVRCKGSDFVFRAAAKALTDGNAELTEFLDDTGSCPLPMLETHREISAAYRIWRHSNDPRDLVADANAAPNPVERMLELLGACPGYKEDPYRKKAMLLCMTLANRPERWLRYSDGNELEGWRPVVDYHIQRTSLRTGIVLPLDEELRQLLLSRRLLTAEQEDMVRRATYDAVEELSRLSGLSHAAIDYLFFQARRLCPENPEERIDCPNCPLDAGCAKQKRMFQPVFRTTAY